MWSRVLFCCVQPLTANVHVCNERRDGGINRRLLMNGHHVLYAGDE